MSNNPVPGDLKRGNEGVRRVPSYSEVLKSPPPVRPAPINTELARYTSLEAEQSAETASTMYSAATKSSVGTSFTPATSLYAPSIWSPVQDATQSATMPRKLSWEQGLNQGAKTYAQAATNQALRHKLLELPSVATPKSPVGLGLRFGGEAASTSPTHSSNKEKNSNASPAAQYQGGSEVTSHIRSPLNTAYKFQQDDLTKAQTNPFLHSGGVSLANTYPLTQQAFGTARGVANQPRTAFEKPTKRETGFSTTALHNDASRRLSGDTIANSADDEAQSYVPNPSVRITGPDGEDFDADEINSTFSESLISNDHLTVPSRSDKSIVSEISEHAEAALRDAGEKPDPIIEDPHPRSFGRILITRSIPKQEAFPGAKALAKTLNPGYFQMPYGSRVICIKTDFVENVQWAIEKGIWGVIDKVGHRIMQFWDARVTSEENVYFLFSVNGQKAYCALAQMAGPWTLGDKELETFMKPEDSATKTWGTIPLTWIFCKNVSYEWYNDIKHTHSGHPIINMWNGMHFPSEVARTVTDLYAKRTHFTNVICWRVDGNYDPRQSVVRPSQIDPQVGDGKALVPRAPAYTPYRPHLVENVRALRDDRTLSKQADTLDASAKRRIMESGCGRQPPQQYVRPRNVPTKSNLTPIAERDSRAFAKHEITTPPNLDGHASPTTESGSVVPCILDGSGNYHPLTSSGSLQGAPIVPTRGGRGMIQPSYGASPAYGQQSSPQQGSPYGAIHASTPTHLHAQQSMATSFKTPGGHEIYPLPIDQSPAPVVKEPATDPKKLRVECLEALAREAALNAQLAQAKLEVAEGGKTAGRLNESAMRNAGVEKD